MTNEELTQLVKQQAETIKELNELVEDLRGQIADLKERLNKNSGNSSKPPSSDGLKKNTKSLRKPSGKRPGGQRGHEGANLPVPKKIDCVETLLPSECRACPKRDHCMENCAAVAEKRYVCDAVIQTSTTEFRKMSIDCCPMGKGRLEGVFPEHVKSHMQYGKNLTAMAVTLNTECALGNDKIHSLIEGLFGIPLSAGTVVNKVSGTALSISGTAQEIKRRIAGEKVVHFDETGTRCEKATKWVHSSSTPMLTYLTMHSKRGEDGVRDNGVMQQLGESSVAVHDCWRTYWKFPNIGRHAVCCVHLLRELKGIEENHPGQAWSGKTSSLLHEMRNYKEDAVSQGLKKADPEKRRRFSEEFDTLVAEGLGMNPLKEPSGEKRRGRPARGKVRAFLERLSEYKDSVFLFIDDFDIPFSNNLAEQSIRMVKVKTKVAGCFRSKTGADDYLKIMSYISTAKKLGASAYEAIRNALDGNSDFIFSLQRC